MKNIDKLKQLDVKDFVKIISDSACYCCIYNEDCLLNHDCENGIEKWLEKEV